MTIDDRIRPFKIDDVPRADLDDLSERLARTRWAPPRRRRVGRRHRAQPRAHGRGRVPAGHRHPPARRGVEHDHHWSEFDRGGHFAAMETPDLLVADVRTFFRTVR